MTMNSKSKLTGARQGFETIMFLRFKKDCFAAAGKGPLVYPEFLRINLFNGPEIRLKSFIARLKKLVSPMKARTSRTDVGIGQFFITRILASPGRIPLSLQIS